MRSKVVAVALISLLFAKTVRSQSDELLVQGQTGNLFLQHTVVAKETWYSIGRLYNLNPKELAPYNKLVMTQPLSIGQEVQIPLTAANFSQNGVKAAGETLVPLYYIIQEKEWMYRISVNHNKVPIPNLEKWNNINKDQVRAGLHIIVGFLKVKTALSALATRPAGATAAAAGSGKPTGTTAAVATQGSEKPAGQGGGKTAAGTIAAPADGGGKATGDTTQKTAQVTGKPVEKGTTTPTSTDIKPAATGKDKPANTNGSTAISGGAKPAGTGTDKPANTNSTTTTGGVKPTGSATEKPANTNSPTTTGSGSTANAGGVTPVSPTGKSFNGGYFKNDFTDGGKSAEGMSGTFKSSSGWQDGKYYALMNNVPVGTIVRVTVGSTGKIVYVKVLGQLPDMKESAGLTIRISNAAAGELGEGDGKFNVSLKY